MQQSAYMSPPSQDKEMKKMQLALDAASQASTHKWQTQTSCSKSCLPHPWDRAEGSLCLGPGQLLHVHPLKLQEGENISSSQSCWESLWGKLSPWSTLWAELLVPKKAPALWWKQHRKAEHRTQKPQEKGSKNNQTSQQGREFFINPGFIPSYQDWRFWGPTLVVFPSIFLLVSELKMWQLLALNNCLRSFSDKKDRLTGTAHMTSHHLHLMVAAEVTAHKAGFSQHSTLKSNSILCCVTGWQTAASNSWTLTAEAGARLWPCQPSQRGLFVILSQKLQKNSWACPLLLPLLQSQLQFSSLASNATAPHGDKRDKIPSIYRSYALLWSRSLKIEDMYHLYKYTFSVTVLLL